MNRAVASALLLLAACHGGPAWNASERRELMAFQTAVRAQRALAPDAVDGAADFGPLPDGVGIDDLDRHGNACHGLDLYGIGRNGLEHVRCRFGVTHQGGAMDFSLGIVDDSDEVVLAIAGRLLRGFDRIDAVTPHPSGGLAIVGQRHGEQTIVAGAHVWQGSLWNPALPPQLSADGVRIAFAQRSWGRDLNFVGSTDDPEHAPRVDFAGVLQWPPWLPNDPRRIVSIVEVDGRWQVRDGDRIVAVGDASEPTHAFWNGAHELLTARLVDGGRARFLIGDRSTPPLDDYRICMPTADGAHYAAIGRDGEREVVVVDGAVVARPTHVEQLALSADGSTWAFATAESGGVFVQTAAGRRGPFDAVTELKLATDGSAPAFAVRNGRERAWWLDDRRIGDGYTDIDVLDVLPHGAGVVFAGKAADGRYLVTPAARSGPWDDLGEHWLGHDGTLVFVASRAGAAFRRALAIAPAH